ncbi:MAG: hypothetical protein AB1716_05040 [Planctomycetota bacterium]
MDDLIYQDDRCSYRISDPRFDPIGGNVIAAVSTGDFRVVGTNGEPVIWPIGSIRRLQVGRLAFFVTGGDYGIRFGVPDPNNVYPGGLSVEIGCRNEYYARMLALKLGEVARLDPEPTEEERLGGLPF